MKGTASVAGIDIAKRIIAIHVEDTERHVLTQKNVARSKVLTFFSNLPPCIIGIESCGGQAILGSRVNQAWARYATDECKVYRTISS